MSKCLEMAPTEHVLRDMPADTTLPTPSEPSAKPQNTHSTLIGFICVLISIAIMITLSELNPVLFDHRYQKPYFVIYLTQTVYTLMLIPWCILKLRSVRESQSSSKPVMLPLCESSRLNRPRFNSFSSYQSITINGSEFEVPMPPNVTSLPTKVVSQHLLCLSSKMRRFLLPAMSVAALVFSSNYLFFQALYYSIASVNNVLFQSQCVFVLIFSILFLGQKLTLSSALSVVLSLSGVAMIALLGDESEDDAAVDPSPIGVVFCLLAAMTFALFQVRMSQIEKKYFEQETKGKLMDTLLFQALMGMSVCALAWPGLIVLDALQIEPFAVPNVLECVALLFSTSMSMIYYGALLIGIAYKGALFMSTGVLLAIPAMFGVDMVLHGLVLTPFTIVGSLCIMIGFAVMQMNKGSR